jgi:cytochrome P450
MIHAWSLKIGASRGMVEPNVLREARAAIDEFRAYLAERTAAIRSGRGQTGTIVQALLDDEEREHLTPDELTANFVLLLFAGHETTTNLIATGLLSLLEARSQWELLCSDPPTMAPKATEELLRYVSPVQLTQRVAREDVSFGDVSIPEGRHVIMLNGSANRDEAVFDRPDELDVERDGPGHLDFGFGPHFCLGAALARLESQVVFSRLATRHPEMELANPPGELRWAGNAMLRTLVELPVAPGPRHGAATAVTENGGSTWNG